MEDFHWGTAHEIVVNSYIVIYLSQSCDFISSKTMEFLDAVK